MEAALQLDGSVFAGRKLRVSRAKGAPVKSLATKVQERSRRGEGGGRGRRNTPTTTAGRTFVTHAIFFLENSWIRGNRM